MSTNHPILLTMTRKTIDECLKRFEEYAVRQPTRLLASSVTNFIPGLSYLHARLVSSYLKDQLQKLFQGPDFRNAEASGLFDSSSRSSKCKTLVLAVDLNSGLPVRLRTYDSRH